MKRTYIRDGRAPIPKEEKVSRIMSAIRGKNTKPELLFRKILRDNSLWGYRLHWKKAPGCPDICYPGRKIAIFVNGCFWHRCPNCKLPLPKSHKSYWEGKFKKTIERDKKKVKELEANHWKVFTIWECELNSKPLSMLRELKKLFK